MLVRNLLLSVIPVMATRSKNMHLPRVHYLFQLAMVLWLQRNQQGEIQYFTPAERKEEAL